MKTILLKRETAICHIHQRDGSGYLIHQGQAIHWRSWALHLTISCSVTVMHRGMSPACLPESE